MLIARSRRRLALALALTCAFAMLLLPSAAFALAEFTVDDTGDQADAMINNSCDIGNGKCTLRAALAEANASAEEFRSVKINLATDSVISIATPLSIPTKTVVLGCSNGDDPLTKPCVTIEAAISGAAVAMNGADSQIADLAIVNSEGASSALIVGGTNNYVKGSWFGLRTNGTAVPMAIGVIIRGANSVIGSFDPVDGNTFANIDESIIVDGGDETSIFGNRIGTNSEGLAADQNGHTTAGGIRGITITRNGADVPLNTQIGGTLSNANVASLECDGPCNVIGRMSDAAIDLNTSGAPGATAIYGNYIGVDATGASSIASPGSTGIDAGSAASLAVGGVGPEVSNVIAGGAYAVRKQSATGALDVSGNRLGMNAAGTSALPPTVAAVDSAAAGTGLDSNRITAHPTTGTGVILTGDNAYLTKNVFGLGVGGVSMPMQQALRIQGSNGVIGNLGVGNTICGSTGGPAISIEGGDSNQVEDNSIGVDEAGNACLGGRQNAVGVVVQQVGGNAATSNSIGAPSPGMNTISNSVGDAIVLATTGVGNAAADNLGTNNGGLMVDIGGFTAGTPTAGDGAGNPDNENGDKPTPVISSATTLGIQGTGAVVADYVYVFATSSAVGSAPNGVQTLLGVAQAAAGGTWSLTYSAPLANDTRVTVIERTRPANVDGEFSAVMQSTDATPPNTVIDSGPTGLTATPTFAFSAPGESSATFECRIDTQAFAACASPFTAASITDGAHTLEVRARDAAGNADPTPATRAFTLDTTAPQTRITAGPAPRIRTRTASLSFDATGETGVTFQCSVDGGAMAACASTLALKGLKDGTHTIRARAIDSLGNVDATPAVTTFTVDTVAPSVGIVGRSSKVSSKRIIKLEVTCLAAEKNGPCVGTVVLKGAAKLGTGAFKIAPGKSATVIIRLSRKSAALVTELGSVKVKATITATDAVGNRRVSQSKLTLTAP